jgi:HEAT repeat protein
LISIMTDTSQTNRVCAIDLVGMHHRELGTNALPAVQPLLKCLKEKDSQLVISAAQALSHLQLQPEEVVPALEMILENDRAEVRAAVLNSIRDWPVAAERCAPALVQGLTDQDLQVRQVATNSLMWSAGAIRVAGRMGELARPAAPVIVQALQCWHVETEAADALGNLGFDPPLVVAALKRRVRIQDTRGAVAAANALGKFGAKASWAVPEIMEAFIDNRLEVRTAATNAVLKIMPSALNTNSGPKEPNKNTNPGIFRL